jgi:integrase
MERLGHRSERMAMRYQHAARERMRQLASGMGGRLGGRLGTTSEAKSEAEAS